MTMPAAPRAQTTFDTASLEIAAEKIVALYGDTTVLQPQDVRSSAFAFRLKNTMLRDSILMDTEVRNWTLNRITGNFISIMLPETGGFSYRCGARTVDHVAHMSASIGRPGEKVRLSTSHGRALSIYAPLHLLIARAERMLNESAPFAGEMATSLDLSSPVGKALSRNLRTAVTEAESLGMLGFPSVALSGYEDTLLNLSVVAIFPGVAARLAKPQPDCGSATTSRARDYLLEHAAETVDISRLALSLGVSMRSLQENFRRRFGLSPREYLFESRLEIARKLLLGADASSVTTIAMDSGFKDLSQFAEKYRHRYGELPSETHRRKRSEVRAAQKGAPSVIQASA